MNGPATLTGVSISALGGALLGAFMSPSPFVMLNGGSIGNFVPWSWWAYPGAALAAGLLVIGVAKAAGE
jgi:hypothetical protein